VRTRQDLKKVQLKVAGLLIQELQFKATMVRKLANIIILETIQRRMESAGFSRKIIDSTFIDNIEILSKNKVRIFIVSDYFSEDGKHFDVSLAREEGTTRHFVKPDEPTEDRPNPHLKWITEGKAKYSKGHWVDGIIAMFIIRNTIQELREAFRDEYYRALRMWYVANLSGVVTVAG